MKVNRKKELNKKYVKEDLQSNQDVVYREFKNKSNSFLIIYIQDLVDLNLLSKSIIKPLMQNKKNATVKNIIDNVLYIGSVQQLEDIHECSSAILEGNAVLFIDGENKAIKLNIIGIEKRSITEPPTNAVIYGPREGFVESLNVNTSLIRKRLQTPQLKIEEFKVGSYTKTKVRMFYIDDIADKYNVKKIKERISKIEIDGILDSHYLVSFLEEKKNSIFKQIGKAEKPDIVTAKMLEGRIAIMVDGSPIALTLPFLLLEDIQNSDDYYQKSFKISFVRLVRVIGIVFSIILPSLYVAIQTQHYRIIPVKFLTTLMDSIQGLPFTPFMEMLFVILLFEILYESSLRMPKYLGVALGVVGALILGDTAVKAGLISPPAVMLVAMSGISFYTIPDENSQLSFLRFMFTIAGGIFGLMGITIFLMFVISYLNDINSYGSPYLAPYAPRIKQDLYDGLIKKEALALNVRPKSIPSQKKVRVNQRPIVEDKHERTNY